MKKNLTEMVFILDRSGSMRGLEKDTIGGFNSMIDRQKEVEGEAYVSTILFDHEALTIHDRIDIHEIMPMTEKEYFVRGCTALLDAVGSTVEHISDIHRYIRPEDVPEKTIFVITTDGMENASCTYSRQAVRDLIEKKQKEEGWEFIFLGANMDAVSEGASIGIKADRAVSFRNDEEGINLNYECVGAALSEMRCSYSSERIDGSWADAIRDYHEQDETVQ